ncbi:hypothetical protein K1T71_002748 [Dendrolimus kikuchii]|uniref:Uncharacterized protein n=1 Tax=Dendrolimus kikuchii TaxID=765133 RepID=A0ACC1DEI4_9NEOP|nr:hypothetical protein K1T71_002748 [Dendrolimus kikuchii]
MLWCSVALLALLANAQGRAVNISNTWVLPEEGFPVFYRYFRDRISWYEADAVCQFHHANLVTVDTTAQYDAVRAYLKELDISSAVWVGLIRSNPDGDFTWTDYRGLSGDGYWRSAPDSRSAPLCAAADPSSDYRWEARACGGPTVASFICELPVPQWALGNEGCMVRALPALTILYLPESAAVQLTADCGLAGVKRVQCTGNVKREDLLKDLSCAEEEETTTTSSILSSSTNGAIVTDSTLSDQDNSNEIITEGIMVTTEHSDNINKITSVSTSTASHETKTSTTNPPLKKILNSNKLNQMYIEKSVNLGSTDHDNQQSNFIPKMASDENLLTDEQQEKLEDEKHMQHKMLHEEFAKFGNFENIFTQPTDHFVPPLVMAKAKISDDMTVLSLAEKHAQQLAEQHFPKQIVQYGHTDEAYQYSDNVNTKTTTKEPNTEYSDKPLVITLETNLLKNNMKKDKVPKKYIDKYNDLPSKISKLASAISAEVQKSIEYSSTQTQLMTKEIETTTTKIDDHEIETNQFNDGPIIDLKVIIKDNPIETNTDNGYTNYSGDVSRLDTIQNISVFNENLKLHNDSNKTENLLSEEPKLQINNTLSQEVVTITIPADDSSPTILEIATNAPIFLDSLNTKHTYILNTAHISDKLEHLGNDNIANTANTPINHTNTATAINEIVTTNITSLTTENILVVTNNTNLLQSTVTTEAVIETSSVSQRTEVNNNDTKNEIEIQFTSKEKYEESLLDDQDIENNTTDTSETVDDFQSPLLSGANEPLPRPNRSRRPQQQQNRSKFNPFRILG